MCWTCCLSRPAPSTSWIEVYLDFERLYALDQAGGFFITRAKRNLDARRVLQATTRLLARPQIAA
jgi:hypothetical protein